MLKVKTEKLYYWLRWINVFDKFGVDKTKRCRHKQFSYVLTIHINYQYTWFIFFFFYIFLLIEFLLMYNYLKLIWHLIYIYTNYLKYIYILLIFDFFLFNYYCPTKIDQMIEFVHLWQRMHRFSYKTKTTAGELS